MTSIENHSETELVNLLQQGNVYAYELIFRRYYVSLCGFAARFIQHPDIAEEIVQNIFLKLWENHAGITIDTSLKSYLFRATHNRCSNYIAHIKVQNKYLSFAHEALTRNKSFSDPVSDSLAYKELNDKIIETIDQLPTECRKVFKLSRFEGLKYSEIARQLDISIKTVETQISRALSRLREELKEYS